MRTPLLLATAAMLVGGALLTGQVMAKNGPLPATPWPITVTPASHQRPSGPASPPSTSQCATDESGHDDRDAQSDDGMQQDCDSDDIETVGPTPQWLSDDHSGDAGDHSQSGDLGEGAGGDDD
jgi:hypothetical protein